MSTIKDEDILAVHQALIEAETPETERCLYYIKYSWWKHPIMRFRQFRQVRKLLVTDDKVHIGKEGK